MFKILDYVLTTNFHIKASFCWTLYITRAYITLSVQNAIKIAEKSQEHIFHILIQKDLPNRLLKCPTAIELFESNTIT